MRGLPIVHSPIHAEHDPPYECNAGRQIAPPPEGPQRADAILTALVAAGAEPIDPRPHGDVPLHAVHDPAMVGWMRDAWEQWRAAGGPPVLIPDTFAHRHWRTAQEPRSPLGAPGWWCTDTATPLVEGSYRAARAAVDVALTAADAVLGGAPAAYGLCRPPGHHSGRDHYGGFCLFNPAAVTAQALAAEAGRIAVLDVDYHHGNGTQEIFWERSDVMYVSVHADPADAYPYFSGTTQEIGGGRGRGATRNLPLPQGTDGPAYLAAVAQACEVVLDAGVDALVVSLGVDTAAADPICGFEVPDDAYGRLGGLLAGLGIPTVLVQEGGYDLRSLATGVVAVLRAFAPDDPSR